MSFDQIKWDLGEMLTALRCFHAAGDYPRPTIPTVGHATNVLLRYKLLREENEEFLDAAMEQNIVEVADALTDCLYVVLGSFVGMGLQEYVADLFWEVHRSNMTKFQGKQQRSADGKQLKSDKYEPPDIKRVLGILEERD